MQLQNWDSLESPPSVQHKELISIDVTYYAVLYKEKISSEKAWISVNVIEIYMNINYPKDLREWEIVKCLCKMWI